MEIHIPYTPRKPQMEIHQAIRTHRHNLVVSHRRMGKSVCAVNQLILSALTCTKNMPKFIYVAPFRNQAKSIAWDLLKEYSAPIPGRKINESELKLTMPNYATIQLYGADNPDVMRGLYADGIILDEYAQIAKEMYSEIVLPMITDRQGWVLFLGTPKGRNHFFDTLNRFKDLSKSNPTNYWYHIYRASETGIIPPDELEEVKRQTPIVSYNQEWECSFDQSNETTLIPNIDIDRAALREIDPDNIKDKPLVIGVDPARYGDDCTGIVVRKGLQLLKLVTMQKSDNVDVAKTIGTLAQQYDADAIFCDAGQGSGIIDILKHGGFPVYEIPFGGKPIQSKKYVNKKAEIWSEMAEWIKGGSLNIKKTAGESCDTVKLESKLMQELAAPNYDFDSAGRLRIESKSDLKHRLGWSPDLAEALAVTFALPVIPKPDIQRKTVDKIWDATPSQNNGIKIETEYNPLDY